MFRIGFEKLQNFLMWNKRDIKYYVNDSSIINKISTFVKFKKSFFLFVCVCIYICKVVLTEINIYIYIK